MLIGRRVRDRRRVPVGNQGRGEIIGERHGQVVAQHDAGHAHQHVEGTRAVLGQAGLDGVDVDAARRAHAGREDNARKPADAAATTGAPVAQTQGEVVVLDAHDAVGDKPVDIGREAVLHAEGFVGRIAAGVAIERVDAGRGPLTRPAPSRPTAAIAVRIGVEGHVDDGVVAGRSRHEAVSSQVRQDPIRIARIDAVLVHLAKPAEIAAGGDVDVVFAVLDAIVGVPLEQGFGGVGGAFVVALRERVEPGQVAGYVEDGAPLDGPAVEDVLPAGDEGRGRGLVEQEVVRAQRIKFYARHTITILIVLVSGRCKRIEEHRAPNLRRSPRCDSHAPAQQIVPLVVYVGIEQVEIGLAAGKCHRIERRRRGEGVAVVGVGEAERGSTDDGGAESIAFAEGAVFVGVFVVGVGLHDGGIGQIGDIAHRHQRAVAQVQ